MTRCSDTNSGKSVDYKDTATKVNQRVANRATQRFKAKSSRASTAGVSKRGKSSRNPSSATRSK